LVVAGSPHGSASLFDLSSPTPTVPVVELKSPGYPYGSAGFGSAVATAGNTVVVGAAYSAYMFDAATHALVGEVYGNDQSCGSAVAIAGNLLAVGDPEADSGATESGQAFIYNATNSALVCKLVDPNPTSYGYFGASIAISGNV